MTAEIDLLPLPEGEASSFGNYEVHDNEAMIECARANVARNTALLRAEIEALRAEVAEAREFRDKIANAIGNDLLRSFIEKHGEPVPLTIRMQAAEARAERLAEAVRKLEEREQRDEALLRQALEVLSRAHQAAMVQTLKARIPECAEFGGIAQDLDFVVTALHERLGSTAGEVK